MNKLKVGHQSYLKYRKLDAFEQKINATVL